MTSGVASLELFSSKRNLETSIYITNPETLFRQAGLAVIDHANVSGTHFHLIPGEEIPDEMLAEEKRLSKEKKHKLRKELRTEAGFRYPTYQWASNWLQMQFWEELKNRRGEETIMRFLLDRLNNNSTARAYAFEPHVFRTVENSGFIGQYKLLTANGSKKRGYRKIGPLRRKTFYDFSELPTGPGAHDGYFYVPMQTNHTSMDFYVPEHGLLVQVTVGQKHGLKQSGLDAALDSGIFNDWRSRYPGQKLRVVFLCDSYNYGDLTRQRYRREDGHVLKRDSKLNETFEQFALELDVSRQLAMHLNVPGEIVEGDETFP